MRHIIAAILANALAAWLVLWWPVAGRWRYRRHAMSPSGPRWRASIRRKWATVAVLVPIVWWSSATLHGSGIRAPDEWTSTLLVIVGVAVGAVIMEVRVRVARLRPRLRRVVQPFVQLIPRRDERLRFVWMAVTAGVTEELLYRSFGLSYVHWLWPHASSDTAVLVTSAAFGLAHLYQGPKNVLLTGLLGAMFGFLVIDTQSVFPAIIVHTLIDLRILLLTPLLDLDLTMHTHSERSA